MAGYLYRGVSVNMHLEKKGLVPKNQKPFSQEPTWGQAVWDNSVYGESEINAVIKHQLHQAGYATSGISTTPIFNRASFYATHGGKYKTGYVYKIDQAKLSNYGIMEFIVADYVNNPSIPEDEEVILVSSNFAELPQDIVIDIVEV